MFRSFCLLKQDNQLIMSKKLLQKKNQHNYEKSVAAREEQLNTVNTVKTMLV